MSPESERSQSCGNTEEEKKTNEKNQNDEELQNEGVDLDVGDIAREVERREEIYNGSSSEIEDITADIMAEYGVFGNIMIANSQNQMRERC